ncbi:MAG: S-adenosyl-l-methionine hydroxide adenosyltransferase family protein [Nitrospiria bacterium]
MSKADAAKTPIITLTTDFGLSDYFVGVLKGVLARSTPHARLIDITHGIPPQDTISAAFVVRETLDYFPEGTIHLVVVDPGVGTARRKIIVTHKDQFFVAPDNGVLTYLFNEEGSRVFEVRDTVFLKFKESPTFAGRDHFAPIAALLAQERSPKDLGKEIFDARQIDGLCCKKDGDGETIVGKIVYVDQFGNGISNVKSDDLGEKLKNPKAIEADLGRHHLVGLKKNYAEAKAGELSFLINSSAYVEIFSKNTSAQKIFKFKLMDDIIIH